MLELAQNLHLTTVPSLLVTHIRGLITPFITTHEPPSRPDLHYLPFHFWGSA